MTEIAFPTGASSELEGLDPEQRAAVEHDQGPLLIVAGAGTGKTTVIARRIAHLISSGRARPSQILLTGATGFLEREIAAALLRTTGARLHCLVRDQPGSPAGARAERLRRQLGAEPWRLALVPGDLQGTSLANPALAHEIDTVVHCAADVNLFAPYPSLRGPNVLATRKVLELAARGAPKAIHFVSTTGVFLSPRYRSRTVYEDAAVEGAEGLRNGYAQSKWVADTMMARARLRGVPQHEPQQQPGDQQHDGTAQHGEHLVHPGRKLEDERLQPAL